MRGRRSAEAPDCVGSDMRAHGDGLRTCEAYGRAVVEEVRGATEGEGIVSWLFPEEFEERLTAWQWERMWSRRRNCPWLRPEVDMMVGRKARSRSGAAYASRYFRTLTSAALLSSMSGSA